MARYRATLDISKKFEQEFSLPLFTGDCGNTVRLEFYQDGEPCDMSGVQIYAKRADGTVLTSAGVTEGNSAEFTLYNNMFSCVGELQVQVVIVDAFGDFLTDGVLYFTVREGFSGEADGEGSDEVCELTDLIRRAGALIAQIGRAEDAADDVHDLIEQFGDLTASYDTKAEAAQKTEAAFGRTFLCGNGAPDTVTTEADRIGAVYVDLDTMDVYQLVYVSLGEPINYIWDRLCKRSDLTDYYTKSETYSKAETKQTIRDWFLTGHCPPGDQTAAPIGAFYTDLSSGRVYRLAQITDDPLTSYEWVLQVSASDLLMGSGAPDSEVCAPFVGALYLDTAANKTYQCVGRLYDPTIGGEDPYLYEWEQMILASDLTHENWTFTKSDNTTVTKAVTLWN